MKILAIKYDMTKITTVGAKGSSTESFVSSRETIRIYPITELPTEIVSFPRILIKLPIPFVVKKLPECFKASTNADIALEQKLLPVRQT